MSGIGPEDVDFAEFCDAFSQAGEPDAGRTGSVEDLVGLEAVDLVVGESEDVADDLAGVARRGGVEARSGGRMSEKWAGMPGMVRRPISGWSISQKYPRAWIWGSFTQSSRVTTGRGRNPGGLQGVEELVLVVGPRRLGEGGVELVPVRHRESWSAKRSSDTQAGPRVGTRPSHWASFSTVMAIQRSSPPHGYVPWGAMESWRLPTRPRSRPFIE